MSRKHPECPDSDSSRRSVVDEVLLRQEPDGEEDEEEQENEDERNEDHDDADGYSE
jgi:hypothetical protein